MTQASLNSANTGDDARLNVCQAAIAVDRALARMDEQVNWLERLTPVNIAEIWDGFRESNYRYMPDSRFSEGLENDAPGLRRELFALPVREVENHLLQALLLEKQREIDQQIELVRMRDKDGFILASIDLFGPVGDRLLQDARNLLDEVPVSAPDPDDAGAVEICAAASHEVAKYSARHPHFRCEVVVDPTAGTSLYVSQGDFHVAHDFRTSHSRIDPLIQHEIGTHVITRYNGQRQPLHTLAGGLADYDELQEGVAVLAEYLAGYLPAHRLRTLGARVVAAHMAVEERAGPEIYACLVDEYDIDSETAFDTALRAKRGGGLTKDALYLKGLMELLAYLREGGDFEILFLGKFALKHLHSLESLIEGGILHRPEILPTYLDNPTALARLAEARTIPITQFYQESTPA